MNSIYWKIHGLPYILHRPGGANRRLDFFARGGFGIGVGKYIIYTLPIRRSPNHDSAPQGRTGVPPPPCRLLAGAGRPVPGAGRGTALTVLAGAAAPV